MVREGWSKRSRRSSISGRHMVSILVSHEQASKDGLERKTVTIHRGHSRYGTKRELTKCHGIVLG